MAYTANIVWTVVSLFFSPLLPAFDEPHRDNTIKTPAVRTLILQIYTVSDLPLLGSGMRALRLIVSNRKCCLFPELELWKL